MLASVARLNMLSPKNAATDADTIKPAHQFAVVPAFNRMGTAHFVQLRIERDDALVDPGFITRLRTARRIPGNDIR